MSYYAVPVKVLEDTDELKVWAAASVDAARRKVATRKPRAPRKKR
jgi:TfoX/Sxy family transcriptional regulator of competence genes